MVIKFTQFIMICNGLSVSIFHFLLIAKQKRIIPKISSQFGSFIHLFFNSKLNAFDKFYLRFFKIAFLCTKVSFFITIDAFSLVCHRYNL